MFCFEYLEIKQQLPYWGALPVGTVEHCTSFAEVMGSNLVQVRIFLSVFSQLLELCIYLRWSFMYLHVHLYLQIKFKISHIFTYNRMLINFDQTWLAKNSSKVIIHSFTHSVVRHNPPSKMSFGFQVWEHNIELSLLTDSRQNFRRLIKVQRMLLSPQEWSPLTWLAANLLLEHSVIKITMPPQR